MLFNLKYKKGNVKILIILILLIFLSCNSRTNSKSIENINENIVEKNKEILRLELTGAISGTKYQLKIYEDWSALFNEETKITSEQINRNFLHWITINDTVYVFDYIYSIHGNKIMDVLLQEINETDTGFGISFYLLSIFENGYGLINTENKFIEPESIKFISDRIIELNGKNYDYEIFNDQNWYKQ